MGNHQTSELADKKCVPCKGGEPSLQGDELQDLFAKLGKGWELVENKKIKKEFHFPDFKSALTFTNQVGEIAEEEGHHPDIHLAWGKVVLIIWTHKIKGLSESDFILAAKCDRKHQKLDIKHPKM